MDAVKAGVLVAVASAVVANHGEVAEGPRIVGAEDALEFQGGGEFRGTHYSVGPCRSIGIRGYLLRGERALLGQS